MRRDRGAGQCSAAEGEVMDVFAFREELVAEYERFSRSFTNIRAEDVSCEPKWIGQHVFRQRYQ